MLLHGVDYLFEIFPSRTASRWERDVGEFEEELWEEALQAMQVFSLNVTQGLLELYILLRVQWEWERTPSVPDALGTMVI